MSRRRFRSAVSRGPKNNIWSVVLLDEVVVGTAAVEGDIVNAAELQGAGTGFQRYTLLRIRGWLSVSKPVASVVAQNLFMIIYTTDANAGTVDALNATTYAVEDILWTGGVGYPANGVGAVEAQPPTQIHVDVKAMRKIDTSRDVRFAFEGSAVGTMTVSGLLRGLVRKGGN